MLVGTWCKLQSLPILVCFVIRYIDRLSMQEFTQCELMLMANAKLTIRQFPTLQIQGLKSARFAVFGLGLRKLLTSILWNTLIESRT